MANVPDDSTISDRLRECAAVLDGLVVAIRTASLDTLGCAIEEVGVVIDDLDRDGLSEHPTTDLLRTFCALLWAESDRLEAEIDVALRRLLDE